MSTNPWAQSLLSLPIGTVLSITMKGTDKVIIGTYAGEYTRDVMSAILIDTADGSDFPVVAVGLHTIADAHEIGGMHSDAATVASLINPLSETDTF
jgi:hypothetical protein